MKAARLYDVGDIRVEEIADPATPVGDQLLLKIEAAGICGSDVHNFHTGLWMSRMPSTPGHEFVASVVEVGCDVTRFAVGDRVVADSRIPCRACLACQGGESYLCPNMGFVGEVNDGGFAPYSIQHERQVVKLPDQAIDPEIAALSEPVAVALHAANRLRSAATDTVLVGGAGTIGGLVVAVLKHRGIGTVYVDDINRARRDSICDAFDAVPFQTAPDGTTIDGFIDTTGSEMALDTGLGAVRRGGRAVIVGLYRDKIKIDMNRIVEGGLQLSGCAAFDNELVDAVGLLPQISHLLRKLKSVTVPVDAVPEMYRLLLDGRTEVQKVFVIPD